MQGQKRKSASPSQTAAASSMRIMVDFKPSSSRPCGVMVARLTTNQEVVVSSTTSVIIFFSLDRF